MRLSTRAAILLMAALLGSLGTARLGLWQLDRAAQKTALQEAQDTQRALPPLPAAVLARASAAAPAQWQRTVTLQGRWLAQHTVYLDNRQMNGRPGFYALTPLQLSDGSAVLVQRGWLARNADERARIELPALPVGEVAVTGRIAPAPARLYEFSGEASGVIRQNLRLDAFARETALTLRPFTVVQEDTSPPAADGLLRQWPQPVAGADKHRGYAFQWFALSALIIGLYVWFQLIRPRRRA
jgi:surfeit locus 1 family protein